MNASKAFAIIGKAAVSACFGIVYNYTAELFPTVVRFAVFIIYNFFIRLKQLGKLDLRKSLCLSQTSIILVLII